ncbi:MAG: hypothetical protein CMM15_13195 [Rhodospirillaceae bacterium]|nr:hypothetical protein [Rhodospirillaceae bacterium]
MNYKKKTQENLSRTCVLKGSFQTRNMFVKHCRHTWCKSQLKSSNFEKHKQNMVKIMTHVKEHHTYLSRLNLIIDKLF